MRSSSCLGTTPDFVMFLAGLALYLAMIAQAGLWAAVWSGETMPWFVEWSPSLLWIAGLATARVVDHLFCSAGKP